MHKALNIPEELRRSGMSKTGRCRKTNSNWDSQNYKHCTMESGCSRMSVDSRPKLRLGSCCNQNQGRKGTGSNRLSLVCCGSLMGSFGNLNCSFGSLNCDFDSLTANSSASAGSGCSISIARHVCFGSCCTNGHPANGTENLGCNSNRRGCSWSIARTRSHLCLLMIRPIFLCRTFGFLAMALGHLLIRSSNHSSKNPSPQ